MFKKIFLLVLNFVAVGYTGVQLILFPEETPMWLIRLIGGIFAVQAVVYVSDIVKIHLESRVEKLKQKNQQS